MFFKQIRRNAAKNRKGNGLFFGSLVIAIVAFYTLLSLGSQDVMRFLATMESDAVAKLMILLRVVYMVSLFFVFFLVYFAYRYQTDSRRRELGLYLMLGMRKSRLFAMLFGETLWSGVISLLIGLPVALFLTEGVSLATAKLVGLGILGHQIAISRDAVLWTVCGFIAVQLLSVFFICVGFGKTEPAEFFQTGDAKRQAISSKGKSMAFFFLGIVLLLAAYYLGVCELRTLSVRVALAVVVLGIGGTFFFYRGLGGFLGRRIRRKSPDAVGLETFTARQVQENVLSQHKSLAVSSLLLMMALAWISYGISMGMGRSTSSRSVDFSLFGTDEEIDACLQSDGIREMTKESYPMYLSMVKKGYYRDEERAFDLGEMEQALSQTGSSVIGEQLHVEYVISQTSYNHVLQDAGKDALDLSGGKVAVYSSLANDGDFGIRIQKALGKGLSIGIDGMRHEMLPTLYFDNVVADRTINLYLALVVPDDLYARLARETAPFCRNVRLRDDVVKQMGLMQAVQEAGDRIARTGIAYESYLVGIGRNLFYAVAASYLTIYLGSLFWLIANTVIGLKYLIGQRRTKHRYETLFLLGAEVEDMCRSVKKQIGVYFVLVLSTALCSGAAAIVTMFTSFARLPVGASMAKTALISVAALACFALLEVVYIAIVKRAACREVARMEMQDRR